MRGRQLSGPPRTYLSVVISNKISSSVSLISYLQTQLRDFLIFHSVINTIDSWSLLHNFFCCLSNDALFRLSITSDTSLYVLYLRDATMRVILITQCCTQPIGHWQPRKEGYYINFKGRESRSGYVEGEATRICKHQGMQIKTWGFSEPKLRLPWHFRCSICIYIYII